MKIDYNVEIDSSQKQDFLEILNSEHANLFVKSRINSDTNQTELSIGLKTRKNTPMSYTGKKISWMIFIANEEA